MESYRLERSGKDRVVTCEALRTTTGRGLEPGQLVYCVKWEGVMPRVMEGQIIGMDDRSLIVRGTDGLFLDALLTLPAASVFRRAIDAIRAEMQWLQWFLPHDRVDGKEAAERRTQQIAELEQLRTTMVQPGAGNRPRRRGIAA